MTPADEVTFIALWQAGTETVKIAELWTHLRKHVLTS
jgi:hypothetical protein